jgi:hypothetical protein
MLMTTALLILAGLIIGGAIWVINEFGDEDIFE